MSALRRIFKKKEKRRDGSKKDGPGIQLSDFDPTNPSTILYGSSTEYVPENKSTISASSHPSSSTSKRDVGTPTFVPESSIMHTSISQVSIAFNSQTRDQATGSPDEKPRAALSEEKVLSGLGYASKVVEISKAVADTTDVLKPLKAASGITEKVLTIVRVSSLYTN
jgi:hypothetical protein